MSETAITISLLALVAVIGLWIGHFKNAEPAENSV